MNRRGFLRSIASLAGVKALAPLAAAVAIEPLQYTFPYSHTITVEFPKPGMYPCELEVVYWGSDHVGAVGSYIWKNPLAIPERV